MIEEVDLLNLIILCFGTFSVSFLVASIGPTGGLQLVTVATTMPTPLIIPIHAWITGVSAVFRAINLWSYADRKYILRFCFFSALGSLPSTFLLIESDLGILYISVALYIIFTATAQFFSFRSSFLISLSRPLFSGIVTGAVTIFVGASGPLLFAMMRPRFVKRENLMATHSMCLVFQHTSKIVIFGLIGISIFSYWPILLLATFMSFAGTYMGTRILFRIPTKMYSFALYSVMCASSVWLFIRGVDSLEF